MPENFFDINAGYGIGQDFDNFQKLKQDTQERINQTMNPDIPLPSVIDKNYSLNDINSGNTESLKKMLYSDDPYKVQYAAKIIANTDSQADKLYKQGVGGVHQIKYDPSQDKYLNSKFGYDYSSTPENNEQWNYDNVWMKQGLGTRIAKGTGTFLANVGVGTIVKLGEGLGYMGSMIGSIGEDNYFQHVADNAFTRTFENIDEAYKNKYMSIWHDKDFANKGFFAQMGDSAFWTEQVADGVSFMLSAIATNELGGFVFGGLAKLAGLGDIGAIAIDAGGTLGKYNKIAGAFGKGFDFLTSTFTGAENLGGVGAWALSTSSEAAFEAAGVYKETYQDLKNSGNYTDEEAQSLASQRASHDFKGNLLALSLSNAFENKMIFDPIRNKILGRTIEQAAEQAKAKLANGTMSAFERETEKSLNATNKFEYKSKFRKYVNLKDPNSFLRFYGTKFAQAAFMEGLYEENVQLAIERLSRYGAFDGNTNTLQDIYKGLQQTETQAINATKGKDDIRNEDILSEKGIIKKDEDGVLRGGDAEASSSIGMGALIGILGTGFTSKFIQKERQNNIRNIDLSIENYNSEKTKFLSVNDVFKQKENGEYEVDEKGKLIYDEAKLKARADGLTEQLNKQVTVEQLEDPQQRKLLQDVIFSDYIHATMSANMQSQLKDNLKRLDKLTPEQLLQLGFNPDSIQSTPSELLNKAEQLIQAHKEAFDTKVRKPEDLSERDFATVDYNRKYQLYNTQSLKAAVDTQLQHLTTNFIDTLNKEYTGQGVNTPLIDEYNQLIYQKLGLEKFANVNRHSDFYKEHFKEQLDKLDVLIKAAKIDLKNNIEQGGYKEKKDGLLDNNFIDNDYNINVLKKSAEYKNTKDQFDFIIEKLSSSKKGIEHYNDFVNHLQKGAEIEKEANREFTHEGQTYKKSELDELFKESKITQKEYETALENEKGIEKPKEEVPVSKPQNKFVEAFNKLKDAVQKKFPNIKLTHKNEESSLDVAITAVDKDGNTITDVDEAKRIRDEAREAIKTEKAKILEELKPKEETVIDENNNVDVASLFTTPVVETPTIVAPVVQQTSEIKAKKADIEKRRQEELNNFNFENKGQSSLSFKSEEAEISFNVIPNTTNYSLGVSLKANTNTGYKFNTVLSNDNISNREESLELLQTALDVVKSKINAKYDAELAALNAKDTAQNSTPETVTTIESQPENLSQISAINATETPIITEQQVEELEQSIPQEVPIVINVPIISPLVQQQSDDENMETSSKSMNIDTPLMSSKSETYNDETKEKEIVKINPYNDLLNTFIKTANLNDYEFFIEQDGEHHRAIYNFQKSDGTSTDFEINGQIIKVYKNGVPVTFRDVFPLSKIDKKLENLPIITSINSKLMSKEDNQRNSKAQEKAKKSQGKLNVEDVLNQYDNDLNELEAVKTHVKNGNPKQQIFITNVSQGIYPQVISKGAPVKDLVINRFGNDFKVVIKNEEGSFGDFQLGSTIVDFGKGQFIKAETRQLFNIPELLTTMNEVMNTSFTQNEFDEYKTKQGRINKAINFLSSYIYDTDNSFFYPTKSEDGSYKINYYTSNESGNKKSKAVPNNIISISTAFLNVSDKALKDGIIGFEGKYALSSTQYQEFVKNNLITDRKVVLKNGEIYTEKVNPGFSFEFSKETSNEKLKEKAEKDFNTLLTRVNKITDYDSAVKALNNLLATKVESIAKFTQEKFDVIEKQLRDKIEELNPEAAVTPNDELLKSFGLSTPIVEKEDLVEQPIAEQIPIIEEKPKVVAKGNQALLDRLNNKKQALNLPSPSIVSFNSNLYKVKGDQIINITKNEVVIPDENNSDIFNILSNFVQSSKNNEYKLAKIPVNIEEKVLNYNAISLPNGTVFTFDENGIIYKNDIKEIATEEGKKNLEDLIKCN